MLDRSDPVFNVAPQLVLSTRSLTEHVGERWIGCSIMNNVMFLGAIYYGSVLLCLWFADKSWTQPLICKQTPPKGIMGLPENGWRSHLQPQ